MPTNLACLLLSPKIITKGTNDKIWWGSCLSHQCRWHISATYILVGLVGDEKGEELKAILTVMMKCKVIITHSAILP